MCLVGLGSSKVVVPSERVSDKPKERLHLVEVIFLWRFKKKMKKQLCTFYHNRVVMKSPNRFHHTTVYDSAVVGRNVLEAPQHTWKFFSRFVANMRLAVTVKWLISIQSPTLPYVELSTVYSLLGLKENKIHKL